MFYIAVLLTIQTAMGETSNVSTAFDSNGKPPLTDTSVQNIKNPAKWFQWGFDFRFRHEYHNNAYTLSGVKPNHEYNYQRYRGRISASLIYSEDVSLNTRLAWEGREYFKPESKSGMDWDEALFDNFNIKLGNSNTRPLSLILGRQEIMFGDRWLIYDGTTTDGSRTEFFDAARLIWNLRDYKTTVNFIYYDLKADSERWLPVVNSRNKPLSEQDRRGAVVYLENRSVKNIQIDGYFIYNNERKALAAGNTGEEFIVGTRAQTRLGKHWKSHTELAIQSGTKNYNPLFAYGLNAMVEYLFNDAFQTKLHLGYEYLSGDDPNTKRIEAWEPLFGRRALWSELMVFTFGAENNGRTGEWSNLQRIDFGTTITPIKNIEFSASYMPLFANENTLKNNPGYSENGTFRGHFFSAIIRFKINKNLSGHFWSEFFLPGNYYSVDRRDLATFYRVQLLYQF